MPTKSVVIAGSGVGGLSAAIHLRLLGHDVLVLEQHPHVGGKAAGLEQNGFRLDPGPSILILIRLYRSLFEMAGRKMEDYLQFERLDPFTRVFFEDSAPLDLPADREECLRTLGQFGSQDLINMRRLMSKLDQVAPLVDRTIFSRPFEKPADLLNPDLLRIGLKFDPRKNYKALVDGWFASPLLRSFFYGFPSYGGQTYDSKAAGALMIPYLMLAEGVWVARGGVAAIPRALYRLAVELGVEFQLNTKVDGVVLENGKVSCFQSGSQRFEGSHFVSNQDPSTFGEFLGRRETREPSFSYFTIQWGLSCPLGGLKHHTLVVPRGWSGGFEELYRQRQFPSHPIVYLNATREMDPGSTPPGCENLFAVVTSPAKSLDIDWAGKRAEYRGHVITTLREAGIHFSESDLLFERTQDPPYFAQAHGNYQGSLYGLDEHHRLLGGLFPHSNRDAELQNLFYCGGAAQPGAGLPMALLSGKFVAQAIGEAST